ncbi:MAG: hypothetical protein IPK30_09210 [Cellvibrionales bacterium]|nr:hypothetical protein [Cellvibrionales bacterium]
MKQKACQIAQEDFYSRFFGRKNGFYREILQFSTKIMRGNIAGADNALLRKRNPNGAQQLCAGAKTSN